MKLLRDEVYYPLIKELGLSEKSLHNSVDDLLSAISSGRIVFFRGQFKGRFSAAVSKELKRLGAKWDRKHGSWKVPHSSLPISVKDAIASSEARFNDVLTKINKKLEDLLPEKIADKLDLTKAFDSTLWHVETRFQESVRNITVAPKLSLEQRKRIAEEYSGNMRLYIKDWTASEIQQLRKKVQSVTFDGDRYESMIKMIQKRYGVSQSKAKFLARQETSLLVTKFKEIRYQDAGVNEYKWRCVAGSPDHPVRPMHKALDGKRFSWDNPPVVDELGNRKHPGQDFNCRCTAVPIVRF